MCRNIRTLANFDPPATDDEIRASALQFVRKLSGSTHPSRANEAAFTQAVEEVTAAAERIRESGYPGAEELSVRYVVDPPTEAQSLEQFRQLDLMT